MQLERDASRTVVTSAEELRRILGEPAPSRAQIAHRERPRGSIEDLERYYGVEYSKGLYGTPANPGETVT
jgi:hypothetical protein